jgi:hypothetical protein
VEGTDRHSAPAPLTLRTNVRKVTHPMDKEKPTDAYETIS